MESKKEVALYYPYTEINDEGLIKTAALYWDEIQTIIPFSYYDYYADSNILNKTPEFYKTKICKEAQEIGFLKARIVDSEDESVIQTCTEILVDIRQTPQIKENIASIIRKPVRPSERKRGKFTTMYFEKFSPTQLLLIWAELRDSGIRFIPQPQENGCEKLLVPTTFFDMYMSRMASILTIKDGTVPLTNESLWQDAAIDRYIDYSDELKHNQSQLAKLSLQTISIDSDVPLINILRFRNKNREMLLNFKSYIRELARQIATGLDTTKKQCVFDEIIKDKVLPAKKEIEAKLNERDIALGLSAFDIIQATGMGAIASRGIDWRTGIAAAGISLTVSFYKSLREDRNIVKGNPLGYLYRAQKKFGVKK